MKILKFALLGLLLAVSVGCSVVTDVAAYQPINGTRTWFNGSGAIVRFEVKAERAYGDRAAGYCSYMHVSNLMSGWPYDTDRGEDVINGVGCGATYRIF